MRLSLGLVMRLFLTSGIPAMCFRRSKSCGHVSHAPDPLHASIPDRRLISPDYCLLGGDLPPRVAQGSALPSHFILTELCLTFTGQGDASTARLEAGPGIAFLRAKVNG